MNIWDLVKGLQIVDVAKDIGVQVVKDCGAYCMSVCIFHDDHVGDGGKPNMSLIRAKGIFKCHACGEGGSVIDLAAKVWGVEPKVAVFQLAEKYGIKDPNPKYEKPVQPAVKPKAPKEPAEKAQDEPKEEDPTPKPEEEPKAPQEGSKEPPKAPDGKKGKKKFTWKDENVDKAHEALMDAPALLQQFCEKRHVDEEFVKSWKIGIHTNKYGVAYTIPVWEEGKLVAVKTHSVDGGKYFIGGSKGKALYCEKHFNEECDEIYIVEGEGDLWTVNHTFGKTGLTSMSGASSMSSVMSEAIQRFHLDAEGKKIIIWPDNDIPGESAAASIRILLPKEADVHKMYWPINSSSGADLSSWVHDLKKPESETLNRIKKFSWDEAEKYLITQKEVLDKAKKEGNPVIEKLNCYYKVKIKKGDGEEKITDYEKISNFIIRPKSKISVDGETHIKADFITVNGKVKEDVLIHPSSWRSKQRFSDSLTDTSFMFVGTDKDVQYVMQVVDSKAKKVKNGVSTIGFHGNAFVGPGFTITKDGVDKDPEVEYMISGTPFDSNMCKPYEGDVSDIIKGFAENIPNVNRPEVVVPTLGWMFSCFFKERIHRMINYFPILVFFGTSGAGKTSMILTMLRMFGLKKAMRLFNAHATQFVTMKLLSCTNTVPVAIDELKQDQGKDTIKFWKRHLRSVFFGETEMRGQKNMTMKEFTYTSPMILIGEMDVINEQAVTERSISVRPERHLIYSKDGASYREAFMALDKLKTEKMLKTIVQWVLSVDQDKFMKMWAHVRDELVQMKPPRLSSRSWSNFLVVLFGMHAMELFCEDNGTKLNITMEDKKESVMDMAKEINSAGGRPKNAFDNLLEAAAAMATSGTIKDGIEYVREKKWLYLHLSSLVPKFKKWARETMYNGEIYDRKEFLNQAREIQKMGKLQYIKNTSTVKRFDRDAVNRCVMVNLAIAEKIGLDISGFGFSTRKEDIGESNYESRVESVRTEDIPAELMEDPEEDIF